MRDPRWTVAMALAVATILGAGLADAARPRQEVNVTLDDRGCPAGPDRFCVKPGNVTVAEGSDLVLHVANEGRIPHNLTFAKGTPDVLALHGMNGTVDPNRTAKITVPWPAFEKGFEEIDGPNVTLVDPQPGHATLGERLLVQVPSMAEEEARPQPGPGLWALVVLGGVALAWRKD